MITKVVIQDKRRTPVMYLPELKSFRNKRTWNFKPGVNIIVGENGSGKSTLLKLIKAYLLVDKRQCSKGPFNCNVNELRNISARRKGERELLDGVDVYADYDKNVFNLCHKADKDKDDVFKDLNNFGAFYEQAHSSEGECVAIAMIELFNLAFSDKTNLKFNYEQFKEKFPEYYEYIQTHKVDCENEWTILMDEPDRNLSIDNIKQIEGVLNFHKPNTQIICVLHNPLLIHKLSKNKDINIIEMTKGYVKKVDHFINEMIQ